MPSLAIFSIVVALIAAVAYAYLYDKYQQRYLLWLCILQIANAIVTYGLVKYFD